MRCCLFWVIFLVYSIYRVFLFRTSHLFYFLFRIDWKNLPKLIQWFCLENVFWTICEAWMSNLDVSSNPKKRIGNSFVPNWFFLVFRTFSTTRCKIRIVSETYTRCFIHLILRLYFNIQWLMIDRIRFIIWKFIFCSCSSFSKYIMYRVSQFGHIWIGSRKL